MMPTDTSEKGLETLIFRHMTGLTGLQPERDAVDDPPAPYGGTGWVAGDPADYDRDHAVDLAKLVAFLNLTQPKVVSTLELAHDGPKQQSNPFG
ncbi:hypothetical protein [Desulfovulcanus sp.]